MMSPDSSSEFERMKACGRSVCTTTFGLRGSVTLTPVKFFGALSCASQMIRRPSLAICTDMPSPMPPKPPRSFCASSLKFQVTGSPLLLSGFSAGIAISYVACGKAGATAPAPDVGQSFRRSRHGLLEEILAEGLAPIRHRLELVRGHQHFGVVRHVGLEVCRPAGIDLDARQRVGESFLGHLVALGSVERVDRVRHL